MSGQVEYMTIASTAGNANAGILVPSNVAYEVLWGQVLLTTGVTAGARRVLLSLLDTDSSDALSVHSGATVAESLTDQHHEFLQGIYRETVFIGGAIQVPIGRDMLLPPGWTIQISVEGGLAEDTYSGGLMIRKH